MSGVLMFSFGTAAYYFSISKYGGTSVPMSRIKPLIASVIAVLLLNETVGSLFWVGLILIIGGSIILAFIHSRDEKEKGISLSFLRFYIIALSPALFWGVGEVIAKIGLEAVNPIVGSYIGLVFGTITLFIYLLLKKEALSIRNLQGKLFFGLHGLFSFAIGYPALYASIDALGVARASALTSIWPLIGVILSLFLIEKLRHNVIRKKSIFYLLLLGSIMMVIGAMLV
jgi:drug/metabolite transporter (DMT)-like permease